MIRARDVYCDVCGNFLRVARTRTKENPFTFELPGPHFCSHPCAKAYYDKVEANKNETGGS